MSLIVLSFEIGLLTSFVMDKAWPNHAASASPARESVSENVLAALLVSVVTPANKDDKKHSSCQVRWVFFQGRTI